ncbi:PE-PPE domain-containing protein [Mycobacterium sp. IS-1556]|uniref:PE-PPE domain-containing protein n=1 Tax=Mycobacterium sp. IS-1556 TaxID=1772276 RepID=UPI0007415555|nr:PE-PPE domain-containing protein [Mycobacterium sp. IS-1556]KUH93976.1 PE-PPE domain-containing protein [Mycobacterium sp. IS-1556]
MAGSGGKRATRFAMTVTAAGVATSVVGLAVTHPASISATLVDLSALIVVGSSTNPTGEGVAEFFGGKFNDPIYTNYDGGNDIVYVDFRTGPAGIQQALDDNAGERNAVLASGWGAANASLLLLRDRPDLDQTVFILDNDVARPDGGFGTRYPWFALIGVNPIPTPSDVPALRAVNIGYEYDYNSNAPADVLNPVAAVNSLVGYLYTRLNQSERDLPVDAEGKPTVSCGANTCAITVSGAVLDCPDARCSSPADRITTYVTTRNNTTYVTYTAEELPLTRLIRDVFGDQIADLTGPLLKVVVDSAYYGGNPIPSDPSAYRPARLFPSPAELLATAAKVPTAIQQGLTSVSPPAQSQEPATTDNEDNEDTERRSLAATSEQSNPDTTPSAVKRKPQINVVRDSIKAEPGTPGADDTKEDPEDVAAEEESITTAPSEQVGTEPIDADPIGRDTDTDTDTQDDSQDSAAGNADAAA